jgi:hypothetical protein
LPAILVHIQIAEFFPTPQMQQRLKALLERSQAGSLTAAEQYESDEYEKIEHFVILLKTGNLQYLN